jgi:tetratricopeptide (TPR) repeat protein
MLAETSTLHVIKDWVITVVAVLLFGWIFVWTFKRSDSRSALVIRWVISAVVLAGMLIVIKPWVQSPLDFVDVIVGLLGGLVLAVVWRESIAALISKPFTVLYDGGSTEIEPRPFYSIPQAKRKLGKYNEAISEIRKQLERFPTDFEGQMMMAEIQAENLNDLTAAETTIQRLCTQPERPPRNIAFALNSLADWHLKFNQDREAARTDLEKLIDLVPETEFALAAQQRIAHLADTKTLLAPHDRERFEVKEGIKNLGLLPKSVQPQAPMDADPVKKAAEYVKHLEQHPQDTEAREKLAVIYAEHYGRLDLASDQLNQLINQQNQPAKLVIHWINLLADLQIRRGADYDTVRQTLEQIIERYPDFANASQARGRIDRLKLELKANEKSAGIKLGTYEQNIGLKTGRPVK